jgi:hypothetical protein
VTLVTALERALLAAYLRSRRRYLRCPGDERSPDFLNASATFALAKFELAEHVAYEGPAESRRSFAWVGPYGLEVFPLAGHRVEASTPGCHPYRGPLAWTPRSGSRSSLTSRCSA